MKSSGVREWNIYYADDMTIDAKDIACVRLVKASRVAEEFGVTPRTVRNWFEAGYIPAAYRAGRTIRFDLNSVRAAICGPNSKQETGASGAARVVQHGSGDSLGT